MGRSRYKIVDLKQPQSLCIPTQERGNELKHIHFKKQGMSFRQGLPESSHMDVNLANHGTGEQVKG